MSDELTGAEAEAAIASDIEALGSGAIGTATIAGDSDLEAELGKQSKRPAKVAEKTDDELALALGISPASIRPEKRRVAEEVEHALDSAAGNAYVTVHTPPVRAVLVIPDDGNGRAKEIPLSIDDPANSLPDGTTIRKSHKPDANGEFTYVGQLSVAFEPNPKVIGASFGEVAEKLSHQAYGNPE